MYPKLISSIMLYAIVLFLIPAVAQAIPAITCHCFTDRSFDPARPALADPYFLASTQNSFMALVFSVEKKEIVIKKQKGTASDDLWLAYWLAGKGSAATPDAVLQAKQGKESWQDVVASMGIPARSLGPRFSAALKGKLPTSRLAESIVDDLLIKYKMLSEAELNALHKAKGSNQEIILASVIATKSRQPALQVYQEVKRGTKSWGSLLDKLNVGPSEIQDELASIVKRTN